MPEIANQQYGQGDTSGPLGFLRDAWHMAQNPEGFTGTMQPGDIKPSVPPPGAGPAPPLPPGYASLTDPASSGPIVERNYSGGPALPEGYYALTGPPPPGYFDPPPDPSVQQPVDPKRCRPPGRSRRALTTRTMQRGDDLALEQLDARAVVRRLREVKDRVLAAEVAHARELLDDLFGCAACRVG